MKYLNTSQFLGECDILKFNNQNPGRDMSELRLSTMIMNENTRADEG